MAPSTPSTKSNQLHQVKTPHSKHRLNFNHCKPSPAAAAMAAAEHPVEVIGRIRDHPEEKKKAVLAPPSALLMNPDKKSLRVKTDMGYRDFSLDGVSMSEEEDLDSFYQKFVKSRINGVKLGQKCTVMMYGPTGAGKSHTMFGCVKQPGIVYKSLRDILGDGEGSIDENGESIGVGTFVHVTVLEIYNEEIYDLLQKNSGGGGFNLGWPKGGSASKVRLEVMGKKAKNATFIAGYDASKISKEIQNVEKRRIVKSTLCNERSSRSHCMIILDVPTVGGRLMLVDMAGSENIEQAGQIGLEAKLQTAKINQGNTALKRVVESIANGDSHVPFRDSKLTMLLQDSFEDDKSKILMILCASPDPKELHKTVSTLEYGAKAKCIVRGPYTPIKEKGAEDPASAIILGSRIAALDQFISKLQMENKLKEKERNEAQKELKRKEDENAALRSKLNRNNDLEKRLQDYQKLATETIEAEKRKMEQLILQQQQEVENLRQRVKEIEHELLSSNSSRVGGGSLEIEGNSFVRKLLETYSEDQSMVESMDLDRSYDLDSGKREVLACKTGKLEQYDIPPASCYSSRSGLSTVFEEEEEEDISDEEVQKEVIEEKKICTRTSLPLPEASRQARIQNIFTLCGNYRETSSQHCHTPMPEKISDSFQTPKKAIVTNSLNFEDMVEGLKENQNPMEEERNDDLLDLYVKWEASRENPGKLITTLKVAKESSLADVRKLIEIHLGADNQAFSFLVLEDPSGAPVSKEKEATMQASKLPPFCNNQIRGHLACLRPSKAVLNKAIPTTPLHHIPFSPLENKLQVTPMASIVKKSDCISPDLPEHLNSTPFITVRRY